MGNQRVRITNGNIDKLPQGESWDSIMPGLVLRVGKNRRTWRLRQRIDGAEHRIKLGTFPMMSIKDARDAACETIKRLEVGQPAAEAAAPSRPSSQMTMDGLLDRYEAWRRNQAKTAKALPEAMRTIRFNMGPLLKLPAPDITKNDVRNVRDKIGKRGSLVMANRFLAYLGPVMKYAAREDIIEHNFIPDIVRLGAEQERDRVLSDGEVAHIWQATHGANVASLNAFQRLVRFLLVTAQRKGEAVDMEWTDIDRDIWHQRDNKAGRPHDVPLSPLALRMMGERGNGVVFAGRSGRISGFGKWKRQLDERSGVTDWRLHDLRRTAATGMREIGVDRDVVKLILNHSWQDVTGIYDRSRLESHKRDALNAWAHHIEQKLVA